MGEIQYLSRSGLPKLAYVHSPAGKKGEKYPLVMFLGGYRSDMNGTKATYLEQQCRMRGQGFLRFDYTGHGLSEGQFEEGTMSTWAQDALDILDHVGASSVVLVGSSMGGWIALLTAHECSGVIKGVIGIAAAPDFTEDLYARLKDGQKEILARQGRIEIPNDYSHEPYVFTNTVYEDGKKHLLLNSIHTIDFPLRLIQGMQDKDVPWETAVKIQKAFQGAESDIVFVDDGDHRLSRPEDLELIDREVRSICGIF